MAKYTRQPYKIYQRGNIYHCTISTIVNGQRLFLRQSTHTDNKQEAETYARRLFTKSVEQAEFRTDPNKLKEYTLDQAFGMFWEEVGQYHANPRDTFSKINILSKEFNPNMLLHHLTVEDVAVFISQRRAQNLQNSTINRYLALMSAIFNLCKKRRVYVPEINFREFMLKEKAENIKYIPDWETLDKIIDAAAPHLKPIIMAGVLTGLRRHSLLSLKWENIIGNQIIVNVKDSSHDGGKTLCLDLFPELKEVFSAQPKISPYIFTYKGEPIKDIKTAWHTALKKAGVPYTNFHTLRHTHGTWLFRATGNLKLVQKQLGHSDIKITNKYAHFDKNENILSEVFSRPIPANRKEL